MQRYQLQAHSYPIPERCNEIIYRSYPYMASFYTYKEIHVHNKTKNINHYIFTCINKNTIHTMEKQ